MYTDDDYDDYDYDIIVILPTMTTRNLRCQSNSLCRASISTQRAPYAMCLFGIDARAYRYLCVCYAVFVQRVSAESRGELQGGGAVRRRVARQETAAVPMLLRHDVTGHGHRREDVQHCRRRAQVSVNRPRIRRFRLPDHIPTAMCNNFPFSAGPLAD